MRNLLILVLLVGLGIQPVGGGNVIYCDAATGGGTGMEAAQLPQYSFANPGTNGYYEEIKVRFVYFNHGGTGAINLTFESRLSQRLPISAVPRIRLWAGGRDAELVPKTSEWVTGSIQVDISGQAPGLHEGFVSVIWANSVDNGDDSEVFLRHVIVSQ